MSSPFAHQSFPSPTRTAAPVEDHDNPPAPQPGAVPVPSQHDRQGSQQVAASQHSLPHPSAAAIQQENQTYPPAITQVPAQASMPPPLTTNTPTRSTQPITSPSSSSTKPYPISLPQPSPFEFDGQQHHQGPADQATTGSALSQAHHHVRTHSLEHPPGYQQNPYASDMTAEQRAALRANEERERQNNPNVLAGLPIPGLGNGGNSGTRRASEFVEQGADGGGGGLVSGIAGGEASSEVWDSVKEWAGKAGKRVSEIEGSVWKWAGSK